MSGPESLPRASSILELHLGGSVAHELLQLVAAPRDLRHSVRLRVPSKATGISDLAALDLPILASEAHIGSGAEFGLEHARDVVSLVALRDGAARSGRSRRPRRPRELLPSRCATRCSPTSPTTSPRCGSPSGPSHTTKRHGPLTQMSRPSGGPTCRPTTAPPRAPASRRYGSSMPARRRAHPLAWSTRHRKEARAARARSPVRRRGQRLADRPRLARARDERGHPGRRVRDPGELPRALTRRPVGFAA